MSVTNSFPFYIMLLLSLTHSDNHRTGPHGYGRRSSFDEPNDGDDLSPSARRIDHEIAASRDVQSEEDVIVYRKYGTPLGADDLLGIKRLGALDRFAEATGADFPE